MSEITAGRQISLFERFGSAHGLFGDVAVVVFILVQFLDGLFTYVGLHTWGLSVEANPLVSSAVSAVGVGTGLAAAKGFAVVLGMMLHLRRVHLVVAGLAAFYIAVAILPWTVMFLTLEQ
jgi:hypothetical protein